MKWYYIILLILLAPIGAYIKGQTYRNVYGKATMGRDIRKLWERVKQWRQKRKRIKKNITLSQNNKSNDTNNSSSQPQGRSR